MPAPAPENSPIDRDGPPHRRPVLSREFLQAFADRAGDSGVLRFDEFMDLALYDAGCGYYRRPVNRVGYAPGTDFFTASTSGPVFGELVVAACVKLLGADAAAKHTFVEIGAEREGLLAGVTHPFVGIRTLRAGDTLELAGPCIVFSNELFDAQPFRRFRFTAPRWCEIGVEVDESATLREVELALTASPAPMLNLPESAPLGYVVDAPLASAGLASAIARQPWTGLFVAFDYGKSWREIMEACPSGTARAYYRHTQSNDLLARPGEQDLTCHICWDWIVDALNESGFRDVTVATQEAFFVRNAESYIAESITADAAKFTSRKQSLMQLIHGAHLGQKFQVLSGLRTVIPR